MWGHGLHMMAGTSSDVLMIDWLRSYHLTPRREYIIYDYDVKCSAGHNPKCLPLLIKMNFIHQITHLYRELTRVSILQAIQDA